MSHKEMMEKYFTLISKLEECNVGLGVTRITLDFTNDDVVKSVIQTKLDHYEKALTETRSELDNLVTSMAAKACE